MHFLIIISYLFGLINCQLNTTGCPKCLEDRCPKNEEQCLLGIVQDLCGCCSKGVCAKIEGEDCYNSSLVPSPPLEMKKYGLCGKNLKCLYSEEDYNLQDIPYALCVCEEDKLVCGSDNKTYNSICDMELNSIKNSKEINVKNYGPCTSEPKIITKPEDVTIEANNYIILNCEVRGYPIPVITWEFIPSSGEGIKIKLPSDVRDIAVQIRGGPDKYMVTSWVQILRVKEDNIGIYTCIATNSVGNTTVSATVAINKNLHD